MLSEVGGVVDVAADVGAAEAVAEVDPAVLGVPNATVGAVAVVVAGVNPAPKAAAPREGTAGPVGLAPDNKPETGTNVPVYVAF